MLACLAPKVAWRSPGVAHLLQHIVVCCPRALGHRHACVARSRIFWLNVCLAQPVRRFAWRDDGYVSRLPGRRPCAKFRLRSRSVGVPVHCNALQRSTVRRIVSRRPPSAPTFLHMFWRSRVSLHSLLVAVWSVFADRGSWVFARSPALLGIVLEVSARCEVWAPSQHGRLKFALFRFVLPQAGLGAYIWSTCMRVAGCGLGDDIGCASGWTSGILALQGFVSSFKRPCSNILPFGLRRRFLGKELQGNRSISPFISVSISAFVSSSILRAPLAEPCRCSGMVKNGHGA